MKGAWVTASMPFVGAIAAFAALRGVHGGVIEASLYFILGILGLGAATLGCVVAALAFDEGDYMRRAWALMGLCFGLLMLNTLLFRSWGHSLQRELSTGAALASGALIIVANLSAVLGNLRIARAWRIAGLDLRVSAATRWAAALVSLALAVALVGSITWADLQSLFGGNWSSLSSSVSDIADIISLALMAPILLTAFALRGGTLGWPWTLLAVSSVGWLLYDGAGVLGDFIGLQAADQRPFEASLRFFACVGQLSAGLLQASVLAESEVPVRAPLVLPRA
jgi:hypothetical protein